MSLKQTVENVYIRQDAMLLTRKHFWRLLGMTLLIIAVTFAADLLLTSAGDVITGAEAQAVVSALQDLAVSKRLTSTAPVAEAMTARLTSPKFLLFNLCYTLLSFLLSQGLMLGRISQELAAARKIPPRVLGVFSRMDCCVKAVGLALLTGLKIALWILPGLAACVLGAELTGYGLAELGEFVTLAGVGLMFGLGIVAAYRYTLAPYFLADEPDRGIRECITLSTGLMKGRKWQYFKLGVPIWLKLLGVLYAEMLVLSLLTAAIGTSASPAAAGIVLLLALIVILLPFAYFTLQLNLACALFYLKRREPAADAPVSYWLREHTATDIDDDVPADAMEAQPEDISPQTNEEKEIQHEQSDR